MKDKKMHSKVADDWGKALFDRGKISWEKAPDEVWSALEREIARQPKPRKYTFSSQILPWAAAAVVVVLLGLFGLVSSYTKSVHSLPGEHLQVALPDGSIVDLNADSKLEYYPLKWTFVRKVKLEGEAYFKVKKGKQFGVISEHGTTRVLGTSFTIYARDDQYRVTCLTGKVAVTAGNSQQVQLLPNNHVELVNRKLVVKEMFNTDVATSWREGHFYFSGRPLKEVIDEIERQYAVTIKLEPALSNRNFASNFSKKYSVEEVLDFVCKPMNLKFVKQSENVYLIVEKS